jgi:hypothetical protein
MIRNIIQKWKNRETKAKLRLENARLKAEIQALQSIRMPQIHAVERGVRKLECNYAVSNMDPVSEEFIKDRITEQFKYALEPFVEWNFKDGYGTSKVYTGSIYLAVWK